MQGFRISPTKQVLFGIAGVLVFGSIGYGFLIEPYSIGIRHVTIEDPVFNSILGGKRVVQISDLHLCPSCGLEDRVLGILDEIEPDLLFLTGDYVKWGGDYEAALGFLSKLKARYGVWAVMGDYDYSRPRKSCGFCHEDGTTKPTQRHRVKFLRNSWERVELDTGVFWLGGMDEVALRPFAQDTDRLPLRGKLPAIVLSHSPLCFDVFSDEDKVLLLAGDTHGGQIPLPSKLWGAIGYEKNARYNHGLFEAGQKRMFVSRGVGTSHLPFRLLAQPEIVMIHFR